MIRRPPRSTPFPTRRSSDLAQAQGLQYLGDASFHMVAEDLPPEIRQTLTGLAENLVELEQYFDFLRDRKSTRLNSSHANISYAVFCLKKKKNNFFCFKQTIT